RELVDAWPPARVRELTSFLEFVDERDRVDGLAFRIESKGGAIDLRVALAIEVSCAQNLTDRPDRAGGEHHGPEDGLLGLEVLRRDRSGRRGCLGDLDDHYQRSTRLIGLDRKGVHK